MERALKPAVGTRCAIQERPASGRAVAFLEALVACPADLDLLDPLGIEYLVGRETTVRIWIQNGIDDVATLSLAQC